MVDRRRAVFFFFAHFHPCPPAFLVQFLQFPMRPRSRLPYQNMRDSFSQSVASAQVHRVHFTRGSLALDNPLLAEALAPENRQARGKLWVVVDQGFAQVRPGLQAQVAGYAAAHRETMPEFAGIRALPGGEGVKNDLSNMEWVLAEMNRLGLCRKSTVLVIGGGAVLDAVGFAAAVCHRGIPLVRMPTTTLSQCDSGVGVKNAVNMFGKKNFIGAFAVPKAVVNDLDFPDSQPARDFHAGLAEAVKVSLLKDAAFFGRLERHVPALAARERAACDEAVITSAKLHLEHIALGGDPFESRAARPLDFGHWSAHKLEQLTRYQVSHGEAVAMGLALDMTYGALTGLCAPELAVRVCALLAGLGLPLWHDAMGDGALLDGLEEFREHLGGELTITIPSAPGVPVNLHRVDKAKMVQALDVLCQGAKEGQWQAYRPAPSESTPHAD